MEPQSMLQPAGVQAQAIRALWDLMLAVTGSVWFLVAGAICIALWRATRRTAPQPVATRRMHAMIAWSTAVTIGVLFGLLGAAVWTGQRIQALDASNALHITIVGHQWWWDIEYADPIASRRVRLANELRLPLDRPVVLRMTSNDVIHSFWVPNLHGKLDLVPGRVTMLRLRADRPGRFRGQCAEFCGMQHAHMALPVIVEPRGQFDAWLDGQRQPAHLPHTAQQQRGRALFETGSCASCHAALGTRAGARTAPDLTHMASRLTLAGGLLPNDPASLEAWLRDPQAIKPGNRMPVPGLSERDRQDLVAYLGGLQ
jgi:cytochrome c oxidase subunit 2